MLRHQVISYIAPGDLVFDIGANVGDKTASLVKHVDAAVVCVEPQPLCVSVLQERFSNNPLIKIVQSGVDSVSGFKDLSICDTQNAISTFSDRWKTGRFQGLEWNQTMSIKMTTLDDLVREYGVPRYCKIDVEGYEHEVLKGVSQKLGLISFEFTSEFVDDCLLCIQRLIRLGYTRFNLSLGENESFYYDKFVRFDEITASLWGSRGLKGLWGDVYAN